MRFRDPTFEGACRLEKIERKARWGCNACQSRCPNITAFGTAICKEDHGNEPGYRCKHWRLDENWVNDKAYVPARR